MKGLWRLIDDSAVRQPPPTVTPLIRTSRTRLERTLVSCQTGLEPFTSRTPHHQVPYDQNVTQKETVSNEVSGYT